MPNLDSAVFSLDGFTVRFETGERIRGFGS